MKKYLLFALTVLTIALVCSCAKEVPVTLETEIKGEITDDVEKEIEAVEKERTSVRALVESFYEEYFAQEKENAEAEGRMGNAERLEVVKRKYLTENLIEELHLRSRQMSSDAITCSQDNSALYGKLIYKDGKDEDTAIATYRFDSPNGYDETILELHFTDVNGEKLADELNSTTVIVDGGEEIARYEYKTKWANKPSFTDEDIAEMESIKKELDDLEAEGFIG